MSKSIYDEALEKAWDLVHNKYPENNEEIQLVRYAIKTAMELTKRIGELESKLIKQEKLLGHYKDLAEVRKEIHDLIVILKKPKDERLKILFTQEYVISKLIRGLEK